MSTTLFNVLDYGAVGSGSVLDTDGVNEAIENAAKAGGRHGLFPGGHISLFFDSPAQ